MLCANFALITKKGVFNLLGHCNIRTTQIYAKIVDENKRKAVNLIPKI